MFPLDGAIHIFRNTLFLGFMSSSRVFYVHKSKFSSLFLVISFSGDSKDFKF
jgi:hypothetical protein